MARYRLSPEAQNDIRAIRRYIQKNAGRARANDVIQEIRKALDFLASTPGAGHGREDLTDQPVKFWPVYSYLVVYDPWMSPIGIARVLHGYRDLSSLFQREPPR